MKQKNHMQPSTHNLNKPSHILTSDKVDVLYRKIDLCNEIMKTINDEIENEKDDIKNSIQQDSYASFYKKWTKYIKGFKF